MFIVKEICKPSGVGHRLIAEAVVYTPSSAALSRENTGQRRAFGEICQDINRDQRGAQGAPLCSHAAMRKIAIATPPGTTSLPPVGARAVTRALMPVGREPPVVDMAASLARV